MSNCAQGADSRILGMMTIRTVKTVSGSIAVRSCMAAGVEHIESARRLWLVSPNLWEALAATTGTRVRPGQPGMTCCASWCWRVWWSRPASWTRFAYSTNSVSPELRIRRSRGGCRSMPSTQCRQHLAAASHPCRSSPLESFITAHAQVTVVPESQILAPLSGTLRAPLERTIPVG